MYICITVMKIIRGRIWCSLSFHDEKLHNGITFMFT